MASKAHTTPTRAYEIACADLARTSQKQRVLLASRLEVK